MHKEFYGLSCNYDKFVERLKREKAWKDKIKLVKEKEKEKKDKEAKEKETKD